jgi:hypothetical protein
MHGLKKCEEDAMPANHVVHLGKWTIQERGRADLMVEFLRRLNVEVACVIMTDWGELDVITADEMQAYEGREQQLLASKYSQMVQDRVLAHGVAS